MQESIDDPNAIFPIVQNRGKDMDLWGFNHSHSLVNKTKEVLLLSKAGEFLRYSEFRACFAAPREWSFLKYWCMWSFKFLEPIQTFAQDFGASAMPA